MSTNSVALYIEGSAHHLDLRAPNHQDPDSLTEARNIESMWIGNIISEYSALQDKIALKKQKKAEAMTP